MMTFHGGLTRISIGIVAILCLLIPDDIAAGCFCDLNCTIRQLRNEKIEKIAKEYITNYTANLTTDLSSATIPTFNLTSQLTNYTKQTIVNFVLSGDIYSTDWVNFSKGYVITNDSAIFQNDNRESNTNFTWLTLAKLLERNYSQKITQDLEYGANLFTYQLGVFRPSSDRLYNYSSFDPQKDYSPCICSTNAGFSYMVRFAIDNTSLPLFFDNDTRPIGRLMKTDLELAIDNFTSYEYGESYIQSIFETWDPSFNDSSVFSVRLFFKNQYDYWWNSSTSGINSKLSNLTVFQLRYLNMTVNITSLPRTIACKTYNNSQEYTCDAVTAGPTNSQTVQLSSTTLPSTRTTRSTIASSALPSTMTQSVVEISSSIISTTTAPLASTQPSTIQSVVDISSSTISTTTASLAPSQPSTTLSGNTGNTGSTGLQSSQSTGYSVTVPNQTSNNGSSGTNPSQNLQTETTTIPSMTNNSVNLATNSSIIPFLNGSTQTATNLVTGNGTLGQAGSTPSTTITPQIIVNSSTTPFDEDPLFKANADIPVMTKVYNDQLMLKGRGATGEPLTQQALFYSVAIPAAAGLILTTMLLLICLQIDWIGTAASSKSIA